jgi:hypothetical protein
MFPIRPMVDPTPWLITDICRFMAPISVAIAGIAVSIPFMRATVVSSQVLTVNQSTHDER